MNRVRQATQIEPSEGGTKGVASWPCAARYGCADCGFEKWLKVSPTYGKVELRTGCTWCETITTFVALDRPTHREIELLEGGLRGVPYGDG